MLESEGVLALKKSSLLLAVVLAVASLTAVCGREGPLPPPDETPPRVNSTIPANGSVGVPINLNESDGITILFSEVMDASTINGQTITLTTGLNSVPGAITYQDSAGVSTAVFTPSSILIPATLYKITVDSSVMDSYGIPMAAPYISSFSTGAAPDTTPPGVIDTMPENGSVVLPNATISITFSEPVDPATIVFTLTAGSETTPCTMSYSGTTATFTPYSDLKKGTRYSARLSAGVMDLTGNAMATDFFLSFSTRK